MKSLFIPQHIQDKPFANAEAGGQASRFQVALGHQRAEELHGIGFGEGVVLMISGFDEERQEVDFSLNILRQGVGEEDGEGVAILVVLRLVPNKCVLQAEYWKGIRV